MHGRLLAPPLPLPALIGPEVHRVVPEVVLDLLQLLPVRLRQEHQRVDEARERHHREEPLQPVRPVEQPEQVRVALHRREHQQVGDAVGDAVGHAPDLDGEELRGHGPGDGQQPDHGGDDVHEQRDDGDPGELGGS